VAHHRICEEATMDKVKRSTSTKRLLLAAITFLLLSGPLSAQATLVWDWTGDCHPVGFWGDPPTCTQATVHAATTDAYVPGMGGGSVPRGTLLAWDYADDVIGTVALAPSFNNGLGNSYVLPASAHGAGSISLEGRIFASGADGVWHFGGEGLAPDCDFLKPVLRLLGRGQAWHVDSGARCPSTLHARAARSRPRGSGLL
jgi:hypothetical protein